MTLIVSLRIPDGIVIAGDSLSTMTGQGQLEATTGVICPKCNHQHEIQQRLQIPSAPATTFFICSEGFSILWEVRCRDIWGWFTCRQIYLLCNAFI